MVTAGAMHPAGIPGVRGYRCGAQAAFVHGAARLTSWHETSTMTPRERERMASRPEARGRSKIARQLLAGGLALSMGYACGAFTLGGCGGSQAEFAPRMDRQLPERVVEKLRACGERGPAPRDPVKHTV